MLALASSATAGPDGVADLIRSLKKDQPEVRARSARDLGKRGAAARAAVPALGAVMRQDETPEVRLAAGVALAQIGRPAVPELVKALRDEDRNTRLRAARQLAVVGPDAVDAVPALVAALRENDIGLRREVLAALGEIGPAAKDAAPALIALLAEKNKELPRRAASALARIGPVCLPVLRAALKDDREAVRYWSACALGLMGPDAEEAVPDLLVRLKEDRRASVRSMAASALAEVAAAGKARNDAAAALVAALKDPAVRPTAAHSLPQLGQAAVLKLIDGLRDKDADARLRALFVLGLMGTEARAAVPDVRQATADPDARVRALAASTLAQIDPATKRAVRAMEKAASDAKAQQLARCAAANAQMQANAIHQQAGVRSVAEVLTARQAVIAPPPISASIPPLPPQVNAQLDQIVDLIALSNGNDGGLNATAYNNALTLIDNLGPAAIPALLRGVLRWKDYQRVVVTPPPKDDD
ncbi:MAG TPA: HEAT repeat domain-containing protein [Gemmataceae bacterium]|nr:HEAT repeat domain-containing protein [Gemmataceae bacterium]